MWTKENKIKLATKGIITAGYAVNLATLRMVMARGGAHAPAYQHPAAAALMILYVAINILLWVKKLDSRQLLAFTPSTVIFTMLQQVLFAHR